MTTPRDAIAGLIERLRGPWDICYSSRERSEAATQLDSLLKERDALQARVKELEEKSSFYERRSHENSVLAFEWMNRHDRVNAGKDGGKFPSPVDVPELVARALRAEQERDEAIAALKASSDWLKSSNDRWEEINKAMSRLAGPEKEII